MRTTGAEEEVVHVPTDANHHRHHHVEAEQIVDIHVPHAGEARHGNRGVLLIEGGSVEAHG